LGRRESGYVGHRRARTEIEEHAVGGNGSRAAVVERDFGGSRRDEPGGAHDQFCTACRLMIDVHLMQSLHYHPLAALNACHADRQRIHFESEFCAALR
jgi:hypothetical protein